MAVTINGTSGVVFNDGSSQTTAATGFGFKNRLINGSFVIDQRNAGASTSPSDGTYFVDRWRAVASQTNKFTTQQTPSATETGFATRVGAGFTSYLACTSSSAYTIGASEAFTVGQLIEGYNWADMAWGTANAKTVTLSFLVYASAAGTYGGSLQNTAGNYSYVFSYSVASANTWTSVSVTIAGPTAGTFAQLTNGSAMRVWFSLGAGATVSTTAGSWNAATYWQPTGATNVVSTSGAYLYFTGVQLEKGSTATSFDYRPYGTEFQLCQRYYEQWNVGSGIYAGNAFAYSSASVRSVLLFQVPKRAAVTSTFSGSLNFSNSGKNSTITSFSFDGNSVNSVLMYNDSQTGFTQGDGLQMQTPGGSSATLTFSAEL